MLHCNVTKKNIIRQNITHWPELGINYWGINKNATSTITLHFGQLVGDIPKPTDYQIHQGLAWKISPNQDRYISADEALNNGYKNFCVIRNPYNRFVSCYNHLANPIHDAQKQTQHKARFDTSWTPNDFMEHIAKTFKTGKRINKHWRKQIDFVGDLSKFNIVIKLEELNKSWKDQLNCPAPSILSNPSSHHKLQFDHKRLYEIYQNDFEALGYNVK